VSKDALQIGQGSLCAALHQLEYKWWIQAEWGASEKTIVGQVLFVDEGWAKQLEVELEDWGRISSAIALVLK
jgi:hypothetical protein